MSDGSFFLYLYGFVTLIGKGIVLKTISNRANNCPDVSVQVRAKSLAGTFRVYGPITLIGKGTVC